MEMNKETYDKPLKVGDFIIYETSAVIETRFNYPLESPLDSFSGMMPTITIKMGKIIDLTEAGFKTEEDILPLYQIKNVVNQENKNKPCQPYEGYDPVAIQRDSGIISEETYQLIKAAHKRRDKINKMAEQVVKNNEGNHISPMIRSVSLSHIEDLIDTLTKRGISVIIATLPYFRCCLNNEFKQVSIKSFKLSASLPLDIGDNIKTIFLYQWYYTPNEFELELDSVIRLDVFETSTANDHPEKYLYILGEEEGD